MSKTHHKLKGNEKIYLFFLSDVHYGSEQFNEEYFEYALDVFDNIKSDKRMYLLGDLLEAASKHVGNASFRTTLSLDEQLDGMIDYLVPYKKHIINTVPGNHCDRLSKEFDLNVMNIIGKALDIPVEPFHLDEIIINSEPYSIYTAHGKGSSIHAHTAQGKIIRDTEHITADLKVQGHNHRLDFFNRPTLTADGLKRKYYAFSGSFLNYNGYAKNMQLPVLPPAFQIITINKDLITRNTEYYCDQMKPEYLQL